MNSASWSSYQSALPIEARAGGERDDEPRRHHAPPNCAGCGRFVDCNPGSGSRYDFTPDSIFGPAVDEWLCGACAARTPLPPTAEQMKEHERSTIAAYDKAMAESWQAEADAARCLWCGGPLPDRSTCTECPDCVASLTAGDPPLDPDDLDI